MQQYVSVRGTEFRLGSQAFRVIGMNFWSAMNLGCTQEKHGDVARLGRELDRLSALGVNTLRILGGSEGPTSEPYRIQVPLMPEMGQYDPEVWLGLDRLLVEMGKRNMKAIVVLSNFWFWSGGFGQFLQWATGQSIPYDWDTFEDWCVDFYRQPLAQEYYLKHVEAVITRVNQVSGVKYSEEPTVMAWELANEPRQAKSGWVREVGGLIRRLAPSQLIALGQEAIAGKEDFLEVHGVEEIDFSTLHIWVQNWGIYDPTNGTEQHLRETVDWALSRYRDVASWAEELKKPLVLEEYGMARDGWLPNQGIYDPDTPTSNRDRYYQALMDETVDLMKKKKSMGQMLWSWAGEGRPNDDEPRWLGDPPHEPPGWYSIFDSDETTLKLIQEHVRKALS
ncbi:glycoside hydrolase [Basidiobolus meristosporus CBS 931.73]|uniref:mannan endo-1,4-beta-mannosidase n=1 Tax=Basidiobolus meristosporus CBS 931.73 TaxID=1314790 RepID=A0A1Y1X6J3_9FUNG|nr:glycoside hydrolase [Basidiobolus meristosporus CBS 931.73]|eukprot:ORX80986.1 glycoside hydrolase [Basidiobolus meristosporus CBS 931.73]